MEKVNYDKKIMLINKTFQLLEKLNDTFIELSEKELEVTNISKLSKCLAFGNSFMITEKKSIKLERKKYYIKLKSE